MQQTPHRAAVYPAAGQAWLLVALLTLAYVLSFVDRYVLGLLIQPIKADLGLSDEQIGWVIGPAFAIFYATMGLPLGWLADRSRRTWIVAVGAFVWSLATAVSGLARSFWQLFMARMTVGVGEATLGPSAMSMIADSFPPERRARPISVYVAAQSLGGGLASLIGGVVLIWAKTTESFEVPFVGTLAPWQLTFFAVGLPGLALALVFALIREPARHPVAKLDADLEGNGVRDAARYVGRRVGLFAGLAALGSVMTIIAYSQGFLAATFERTWGWPPEKYGLVNGVVLLMIGPATVVTTGYLSDRWSQAGIADASIRLLIVGYCIMVPTAAIPMFMPSPELAFAVLVLNTAGIGMVSTTAITAIVTISPSQLRGQIMALFFMALSMTGLFLGPTSVGMLSARVFGEENIRLAIAAIPAIYGIVPLLFIRGIRRRYLAQISTRSEAPDG